MLAATADVEPMWRAADDALAARTVLAGRGDAALAASRPPTPVVVCLWKRHHRLPAIVRMTARQTVPCELYLWNNDPARLPEIEATVAAASELPAQVSVASSQVNIGGFGRFFWARELAGGHPRVVFVDDDEILGDTAVETFGREAAARHMTSAWAFRFSQRRNYWRRRPVAVGEAAKYLGTGGLACDSSVFTDPRLFRCPKQFWFCEDIWLSYFASTALGWGLSKSAAEVGWLLDEAAQYPGLHRAKSRFFRLLNRRGGWIDPSVEPRPDGGLLAGVSR